MAILFIVVVAVIWPGSASASTLPTAETRIGDFRLGEPVIVCVVTARSLELHGEFVHRHVGIASDQPLRWKARWWSDFGQLYDVRARWWSPQLGVFTSVDEFGYADPAGTLWSWPNEAPVRFSDFAGHDGTEDNAVQRAVSGWLGDLVPGFRRFQHGAILRNTGILKLSRGDESGLRDIQQGACEIAGGANDVVQEAGVAVAAIDIAAGAGKALTLAGGPITRSPNALVSRWGREGLESGDWVMKGEASWTNYILSGKWDPGPWNTFAPFSSGREYLVPSNSLYWPSGWEFFKGLLGQRIYLP